MRFMREDECEKAMHLFEGASETGKISKSALKNWVVRVYHLKPNLENLGDLCTETLGYLCAFFLFTMIMCFEWIKLSNESS